ncbi:hypothetical protein F0562_002474 [Nyssa sinensis]|uniref:Uncharacterized protein n=1 Tax=Nyssa sinensis TaxID=561372 RepID=A0A5J5C9Q5_9ASTE|nr:hypothetical protein F0562_002474 [Nyssa sinensis]
MLVGVRDCDMALLLLDGEGGGRKGTKFQTHIGSTILAFIAILKASIGCNVLVNGCCYLNRNMNPCFSGLLRGWTDGVNKEHSESYNHQLVQLEEWNIKAESMPREKGFPTCSGKKAVASAIELFNKDQ